MVSPMVVARHSPMLRVVDVSISDGIRSFTIAEFASVMASLDIANTVDGSPDRGPKVRE
jgi:hypothetical protein